MDVDRSQFLLLTAAMAATTASAGACGPRVTAELPPPQPASASMLRDDAGAEVPGARPVSPPPEQPPLDAGGGQQGMGSADAVDEWGAPVQEYGAPVQEYGVVPYQGKTLGDPRCASLKAPGPTCESFHTTVEMCDAFVTHMEPRFADAAVGCLTRKSGSQSICRFNVSTDCFAQAASKIRASTGAGSCSRAEQRCRGRGLDTAQCESAVSHARPAKRNALASCIAEFCEVGNCSYDLQY